MFSGLGITLRTFFQDFTLDKCTVELSGLIEQVKDIDEAFCQKYCSVIYAGRCQFFIYDRKQRICSLLSNPIEDYVETCDKVAGPKTPTIEDCQTGGDPCTVKSFLKKNGPFTASFYLFFSFQYSFL